MVGLTTSAWVRSVTPTEPWSNIRVGGFAGGRVSNTKSGLVGTNAGLPQRAWHQKFGVLRLTARTRSFPWANA